MRETGPGVVLGLCEGEEIPPMGIFPQGYIIEKIGEVFVDDRERRMVQLTVLPLPPEGK